MNSVLPIYIWPIHRLLSGPSPRARCPYLALPGGGTGMRTRRCAAQCNDRHRGGAARSWRLPWCESGRCDAAQARAPHRLLGCALPAAPPATPCNCVLCACGMALLARTVWLRMAATRLSGMGFNTIDNTRTGRSTAPAALNCATAAIARRPCSARADVSA